MAYCSARFYAGTETADPDWILDLARSELIPLLAGIPGLQRYSMLQLKDGRIGSFGVFDDRQAARQAEAAGRGWVHGKSDFAGYRLAFALNGEIGLAITGSGTPPSPAQRAYTVARLYATTASLAEANAAIDQEGVAVIQSIPGMLRYSLAKLEDGRIASFAAFETESAARASGEQARALRAIGGSRLQQVFPGDPDLLESAILYTHYR